jgi:hypothetical protein
MILPIEQIRQRRSSSKHSFACRKPFRQVYQFKIALEGITPSIWRSIQVPDCYSFWDLHCAVTDCLGWLDYHLHRFSIRNPATGKTELIGIPDDEGAGDEEETLRGWKRQMADYFIKQGVTADYLYDFGDDWQHSVVLESILSKGDGDGYPRCMAGKRACPPEDCGGVFGYQQFLRALADPHHDEHDDLLKWVGGWFDPEWCDLGLIRFEDPELRWRIAFRNAALPKTMRQVQYHHLKRKVLGAE